MGYGAAGILTNLFSGLAGAVVGALIGGHYSKSVRKETAELTVRKAIELSDRERELRREERASEVRNHLLAELRLDLKLVGSMLGAAYTTLVTDAWSSARGDARLLGRETEEKVVTTYAGIYRYNDGARGYEPNRGTRSVLDQAGRDLKPQIEECTKVLEAMKSMGEKAQANRP
jgi:hypothetical protein